MSYPLLLLGMLGLNWYAVLRRNQVLDHITKPGVILVLILWFGTSTSLTGLSVWFLAGLIFSLLGDVALNLQGNFFLAGLGAFAAAHLCYLVSLEAFSPVGQPLISGTAAVIFTSAVVLMVQKRLSQPLRPLLGFPVIFYAFLISWMFLSALTTLFRPDWSLPASALVSAGAVLFTLSDGVLGWDRFIHPLSWRRLGVRLPYHLGQILLTVGMLIRYS